MVIRGRIEVEGAAACAAHSTQVFINDEFLSMRVHTTVGDTYDVQGRGKGRQIGDEYFALGSLMIIRQRRGEDPRTSFGRAWNSASVSK